MIIKALHNHVIFLLIVISLLYTTVDLPFTLNSQRIGYDNPQTLSFCRWWYWIDWTLLVISLYLTATASIQRHILIFNNHWLRINKIRLILHYIPLIFCIFYPAMFYLICIYFYPCEMPTYDYVQYCPYPCYSDNLVLYNIDYMLHTIVPVVVIVIANITLICRSWDTSDGILPWESYIQLSDIQRPLGLTIDRSSLAHHHFAIGYFCFHSFMYDEALEAFNLAINITPTFIEPYIGKMLACKYSLWSYIDFDCGLAAYNATMSMLETSNIQLSPFQSSLLATVYQWYGNQSSITAGEQAFLSAIADLSKTYPNETDIRVLWGLSLLNVAFETEFQGQMQPAPMIQAREVLETALTTEPNHPGALHYLIHAYDVAQINISEKAINYILTYQQLVNTLSYPQHLLSHIWMRTGSLLSAKSSDEKSIQISLTLCLIKTMGHNVPNISSTQLEPVLAQLNTPDQISSFLLCDDENRAYATEWLSFSRLHTGDWLGTLSLINDLYIAYNQTFPALAHHLLFAYRALARVAINLFYWLPYDIQVSSKMKDLEKLAVMFPPVKFDENNPSVIVAWSEAGYRFSDCIRLLTANDTNYTQSQLAFIIDEQFARFSILSNQTASLN
ncbi:unnamed protein product, partial [Rotaria sordida]